ncbi:MAG: universal stress protein [Caulobacterales bacterium]
MTYLSIVAAVTDAPDDADALAIAADLGKRHDSQVVVCNTYAAVPIVAVTPVLAGRMITPQAWADIGQREVAADKRIADLAAHEAARFGLTSGTGPGASMTIAELAPTPWLGLARELALADLAVVAQSSGVGDGPWSGPLAEALMDARIPVFVARDGVSAWGRPAAVAWDGSFEAGRAVRAALPLLKDASEVAILQDSQTLDTGPNTRADPQRLVDYLTRHGVAVATTITVKGRKAGPALLHAAESFGAAVMVAGAYGHARWAEAVFGGVTRDLLKAAKGPHLFIAH